MIPLRSIAASPAASLSLTIARSVEEMVALRPEWEALPRTPDSDFDRLREWLTVDPSARGSYAVLVRRDGSPTALLVARLERIRLTAKVGYHRLYEPLVRSLTVPGRGIVGDLSPDIAGELVRVLWSSLCAGEADVTVLREVPTTSPLVHAARTMPPLGCRDYVHEPNLRWIAAFPESPDLPFPASAHARRHVRYYENRLQRKYGGRITVRSGLPLDRLLRDVEAVAAKTYQRQIGVGFRDDPATRRRLDYESASGVLRSWVLYLDERPAAFWLGLRYGDTYYSGDTGYDPRLREDRLGEILLVRSMVDLRSEGGVRFFDFGLGDADYKRRYAHSFVEETTVAMFAPTVRGIVRNIGRTTVGGANQLLKAATRRLELFERLRTTARRRLTEAH